MKIYLHLHGLFIGMAITATTLAMLDFGKDWIAKAFLLLAWAFYWDWKASTL